MPEKIENDFEWRIRDSLSRPGFKPLTAEQFAAKLKIPKRRLSAFHKVLEQMVVAGQVHQGHNGRLRATSSSTAVVGILRKVSTGAGFVIPHEARAEGRGRTQDVFVAPEDLRDAHTGDEVLVTLLRRRRRGGQRCGRIDEVLMRSTRTFVGTYIEEEGRSFVKVDGNRFSEPIIVDDPGAKGAQPDDKVVIEMLRFPMQYEPGEAVLTEVLGPRGQVDVDTLTIIHEMGLPHEFPEEVQADAARQADAFDPEQLEGRLDLTKETIVTIDPVDARDFDDAISLTRSQDGHWHLGVHIADVSHFVQPGGALDAEARKRGNSVYLPRRVIPMLPEVISNGLASLQKGKVRFTKSVFIEYSPEGIPISTEFANTAVKVGRRFAYEEVMPILREPEKHKPRVAAKVRALLQRMYELAMLLRERRFAAGALELSLPEVELEYDKQGRITGAHESVHDESHQIIEEFMLAANIAVAQELTDRDIGFLRRIHPDPSELKMQAFAKFARALGYSFDRPQSRPDLQKLLDEVQGKPIERAVNYALLRSLSAAEYSGRAMGHYALAVGNYCHFTSPIRRYPDLEVHRLLDQLHKGRKNVRGPSELELTKLGKHCSLTERRADTAERELTRIKLLTYMEDRIGEELEAVVTGVEPFGLFCQGIGIPVEGLAHISSLSATDYFDYDAGTFSLTGRRGARYQLGDRVRVTVARVDVDRRELDFRIVSSGGRKRGSRKSATKSRGNRPAARTPPGRKVGRKTGRKSGRKRPRR